MALLRNLLKPALISTMAMLCSHCASTPKLPPPAVASSVDISRYLGTWYDIAHLPFRFQKDCFASTATYSLREDGDLRVVNSCRSGGFKGKEDSVTGKARVVDTTTRAKLEVQFFWPFWGDYWILDVDENYQWALVGTPNYRYLWILHRQPVIAETVYADLVRRATAKGYDTKKLIKTQQETTE